MGDRVLCQRLAAVIVIFVASDYDSYGGHLSDLTSGFLEWNKKGGGGIFFSFSPPALGPVEQLTRCLPSSPWACYIICSSRGGEGSRQEDPARLQRPRLGRAAGVMFPPLAEPRTNESSREEGHGGCRIKSRQSPSLQWCLFSSFFFFERRACCE